MAERQREGGGGKAAGAQMGITRWQDRAGGPLIGRGHLVGEFGEQTWLSLVGRELKMEIQSWEAGWHWLRPGDCGPMAVCIFSPMSSNA